MRRTLLFTALVMALGLAAIAQDTKSGAGATASSQQQAKTQAGGATSLTGCLSGPNDEGAYVLKNGRHRNGVEVGGSDDLKAHVGHQVKLTGSWAKSGAEIGENEKNEKGEKDEARERHFKVAKIDHVSETCAQTAAGNGGHKHHHKGKAATGGESSKSPS